MSSSSIPKSLPTGKDPPDKANKSPTPSLNPPKSPQQASSIPEQAEPVRPPFTPFFTLITDPSNSSTHHPTQVHYIFSDDDPEILTSACLSALSPTSPSTSALSPQAASSSSSSTSGGANLKNAKAQKQPSSTHAKASSHREERTVILTLSETGDTVVSAHSLTPTWQILSTEITNAPTWDAADTEGTNNAGGLMLRIEGTDGTIPEDNLNLNTNSSAPGGTAGKSSESQRRVAGDVSGDIAGVDMQALMENFDARMNMLRKVIEASGSGLSSVDVQGEMPQQDGME